MLVQEEVGESNSFVFVLRRSRCLNFGRRSCLASLRNHFALSLDCVVVGTPQGWPLNGDC